MVTDTGLMATKLADVARGYVRRWFPDRDEWDLPGGRASIMLDEEFCREVASRYDKAPELAWSAKLEAMYEKFMAGNRRQYDALTGAGLRVRPWQRPGQPYESSRDLREGVARTGTLYVYLTESGHGPGPGTGFHPLRAPSGVRVDGVELSHNDIFRAVHDAFGHVAADAGFGPRGEFTATCCHLRMYSGDVLPVMFTEQIGQICWFFFGQHLADDTGRLPRPGERGYVPPSRRPYPRQKVFAYPDEILDRFRALYID